MTEGLALWIHARANFVFVGREIGNGRWEMDEGRKRRGRDNWFNSETKDAHVRRCLPHVWWLHK